MDPLHALYGPVDPVEGQLSRLRQQPEAADSLPAGQNPRLLQQARKPPDVAGVGADAGGDLLGGQRLVRPGDQDEPMDGSRKPRVHHFVLS